MPVKDGGYSWSLICLRHEWKQNKFSFLYGSNKIWVKSFLFVLQDKSGPSQQRQTRVPPLLSLLWHQLVVLVCYVGKQMEQHSRQISKQSEEPQQPSRIPQSNTAWHASSVQAASPAASMQQQQPTEESQQAAPPTPHSRHSPRAEHMDSTSQNRQARTQWTQQSVKRAKLKSDGTEDSERNHQTWVLLSLTVSVCVWRQEKTDQLMLGGVISVCVCVCCDKHTVMLKVFSW